MSDIERLREVVRIGNQMSNPRFRTAVLLSISSTLRARWVSRTAAIKSPAGVMFAQGSTDAAREILRKVRGE